MKPFWVYMLRCSDGTYYVGQTDDLERRIAEHHDAMHWDYTSTRLPFTVEYVEEHVSRDDARVREHQLKGWSRAKKIALAAGDWHRLTRLSRGTDRR